MLNVSAVHWYLTSQSIKGAHLNLSWQINVRNLISYSNNETQEPILDLMLKI